MPRFIIGFFAFSALALVAAPQSQAAGNNIKSAITAQINSVNASNPDMTDSMVELTYLVVHPVRVQVTHVETPRNIKLLKIEDATDYTKSCPPQMAPGSKCRQSIKIYLDANKACRLNGTYKVNAVVHCLPGGGSCQKGPHPTELKLQSENFCRTKTITVPK